MKNIFYLLFIVSLSGCKTGKIMSQLINRLDDGLYFNGDLFLNIDSGFAFPEYFSESPDFIGLRDGFNDTLVKQSDSLYIGKKFSVKLQEYKLYFDAHFDPKEMYPIELYRANGEEKKRWTDLHDKLLLFKQKGE